MLAIDTALKRAKHAVLTFADQWHDLSRIHQVDLEAMWESDKDERRDRLRNYQQALDTVLRYRQTLDIQLGRGDAGMVIVALSTVTDQWRQSVELDEVNVRLMKDVTQLEQRRLEKVYRNVALKLSHMINDFSSNAG